MMFGGILKRFILNYATFLPRQLLCQLLSHMENRALRNLTRISPAKILSIIYCNDIRVLGTNHFSSYIIVQQPMNERRELSEKKTPLKNLLVPQLI